MSVRSVCGVCVCGVSVCVCVCGCVCVVRVCVCVCLCLCVLCVCVLCCVCVVCVFVRVSVSVCVVCVCTDVHRLRVIRLHESALYHSLSCQHTQSSSASVSSESIVTDDRTFTHQVLHPPSPPPFL